MTKWVIEDITSNEDAALSYARYRVERPGLWVS